VTACFRHASVSAEWVAYQHLIDHRYFYEVDGRGYYTCGLVRNAVAGQLLHEGVNFADTDFLVSLAKYIDNPSVIGFMIEYAVLASIRSNGLAIDAEIGQPMCLERLEKPPEFKVSVTDQPTLYVPIKFNFPAIDGMIVLIKREKNGKPKLSMFPLQITLASSHSDSRGNFFKQYNTWTGFSNFDVEVQFIRITKDQCSIEEHEACEKWPRHKERYMPLQAISKEIWTAYQSAQRAAQQTTQQTTQLAAQQTVQQTARRAIQPAAQRAAQQATGGDAGRNVRRSTRRSARRGVEGAG
jgi:hypothetical protein